MVEHEVVFRRLSTLLNLDVNDSGSSSNNNNNHSRRDRCNENSIKETRNITCSSQLYKENIISTTITTTTQISKLSNKEMEGSNRNNDCFAKLQMLLKDKE